MAQLPPVNSGPYSQLPSPNDPTLVEAAAQQITTSSLNNYGALPNPEAAYESLVTQSVPSLVGAIQSQDPQYRSVLSSLPAGSTQQPQVPAQVPAGLVNPDPTGTYNFNQAQYKAMLPTLLQNPANSSWKSFGEIPALNQGYMQSVETLQNPTRIKQWQSLLQKQQFYSGSVSGVFDTNTKAAFEEMMASRAIPVALYSQDQQQQAAAASLLGSLGYDMQTLQTDAYHDPVMQHQMVTQWMQAQGPDHKFGDKSELDNFVSQFGQQNLPASWQSVYSAANNPLLFIGQGITKIPIIGALGGLLTNNILPRELQANSTNLTNQLKAAEQQQAKQENLSPTQLKALMSGDQQALANVVSQVQQGSGFMGFMDVYDRARTNALLTAHFLFADAAQIIGGPIQSAAGSLSPESSSLSPEALKILGKSKTANFNPFDPNSIIGQQVAASDGNISQGLFGADWATKNPMLAAITNTATNMADDPISYIPGAAYGKAADLVGSGSRALRSMSAGLEGVSSAVVDNAVRLGSSPDAANLVLAIKDHPAFMGATTVRDMVGGTTMGEAGAKQLAAIKTLLANPDATAQDWVHLFTEHNFDHRIANMSGLVERHGYLSHLGNIFNQTRTGFRASLSRMGMTDHMGQFDFSSNLGAALSKMQDWATLAKLDPADTRKLLDGMVGVPEEEKILAFGNYKDAVIQGIDKLAQAQGRSAEEVFNAITKRRRSLFGAQKAGAGEMVSGFMADPKLGQEMSWTDLHGDDPVLNRLNQAIKDHQDAILMKGGMIDSHANSLTQAGMETGDEGAQAAADEAEMINLRKQELNKLIDQRDAYQKLPAQGRRPSPAITEQLRDNYSFPFSMNELATELNPGLKTWDKAQHAVGMDVLTQLWKPWVLANMGTAMRIVVGEDLIRPAWRLLFDGHPLVAAKLMGEGIGKSIASGFIPDRVSIPFTKNLREDRQVTDEAGNVTTQPAENIGVNLPVGKTVRANVEKSVNQMGTAELVHGIMSKWMSSMDPEVFVKYSAGDINYDQALGGMINKWSQSSMIKPYLQHLKAQGGQFVDSIPEGTYYHGTSSPFVGDIQPGEDWSNLYGAGLYVTDKPEIAASYVGKNEPFGGAGEAPVVHSLEPKQPLKLVDLSKPFTPDVQQALLDVLKQERVGLSSEEIAAWEQRIKTEPGDQVFQALAKSTNHYDDRLILKPLRDALSKVGYHGFQYAGGKLSGGARHTASVIWDPAKHLKVTGTASRAGATEDSARQVLQDTISKSTDPGVAEIRRLHPNVDAHAALLHEFLQAHMEQPELKDMWLNGAADTQKIRDLSHAHAHDGTQPMPVIFAPRNTLTAQHFILKTLNKYPQWMFDKKLSPMIAAARDTGLLAMKKQFSSDLATFYKGRADWTPDKIDDEAISLAYEWSQRNMYMGQRTMLGSSLRNVFPFWGATANMARFYMREALSHPYSGDATLRLAKWSQDQQSSKQQYATGGQGFLALMGFTGGDALSIDPFHSFFLTSDGVDSFVPGSGPWVNLITSFVPGHQAVAEALANTPLSGEFGLDSKTGAAAPIIPWLGQLLTGAADTATAALGNTAPVNLGPLGESVDAQTQQEDELIRQREEQGQPVKPGDEANILSEVGRKFLLEGALRWATPLTPSIVNQPGQTLTNALNAFNSATSTTEKDSLVAAELKVTPEAYQSAIANQTVPQLLAKAPKDSPAVAMAYFDSNVTAEQRDIIGAEHPWVTAYAQSFYDRPIDPETGKPQQTTLGQFNTDLASGGISLENATTYINKIQTARQIQQGWLAVDQLNNAKYAFMRQNGLTTQSSLYKQWDQEVYQPALVNIANSHPAWNTQFGSGGSSGTTLSAEANRTSALRTVMSLNVIPQDPAFETTSSTLWRQALVWRDQASQQIAAMQMGTHSTAEVQLVMDGLQQRLAWLGQQDPTFAQQLDGYSFGKWEDVVTMEADEIRNQELYGIAS